jgi:hypothetical protein
MTRRRRLDQAKIRAVVAMAATLWQRETLAQLRDQLQAHDLTEVTVAEALTLLDAELGGTTEALLLGLTHHQEDKTP